MTGNKCKLFLSVLPCVGLTKKMVHFTEIVNSNIIQFVTILILHEISFLYFFTTVRFA